MVKVEKKKIKVEKKKIIKNAIENVNIPVKVLKEAEKLPPEKRKNYLKKYLILFAKGAAVTTGVLLTTAAVYKIFKPTINKEIANIAKDAAAAGVHSGALASRQETRATLGNTLANTLVGEESKIQENLEELKKQEKKLKNPEPGMNESNILSEGAKRSRTPAVIYNAPSPKSPSKISRQNSTNVQEKNTENESGQIRNPYYEQEMEHYNNKPVNPLTGKKHFQPNEFLSNPLNQEKNPDFNKELIDYNENMKIWNAGTRRWFNKPVQPDVFLPINMFGKKKKKRKQSLKNLKTLKKDLKKVNLK